MTADQLRADIESGLSLDEKALLATGRDTWHTHAFPQTGFGPLRMSDGPNGVRGTEFWINSSHRSACFPCGAAMGATWDPDLVAEVGAALGREAKRKGVHILLGPTVNIPRLPIGGRNFECFSEDPFLTARVAVGYVSGVQQERVVAVIKHFIANDSEQERHSVSSIVDEQSLREIYLPPFEAAVRDARVLGVMSAYNRLNGTHCDSHRELLTQILKEEWGFAGIVVSDWFGTTSTVCAALAGLDVEMPGPGNWWGSKLAAAVRSGEVPEEVLDDKVRRILAVSGWVGADKRIDEPELSIDEPADRALARRVAAEAAVLLKNEGELLPLDAQRISRVALLGPGVVALQPQGGGSAQVSLHPITQLGEAVGALCGDSVEVLSAQGCRIHRRMPALAEPDLVSTGDHAVLIEYFASDDWSGEPVLSKRVPSMHALSMGPAHESLANGFSARLSATLVPQASGSSTFSLASSAYARLLVDGEPVIEVDEDAEPGVSALLGRGPETVVQLDLVAGKHYDIELLVRSAPDSPMSMAKAGYLPAEQADLMAQAIDAARLADVAVVVVSRTPEWESEGFDMETMALPGRQNELIDAVSQANPNTIVVVNAGAAIAMPWLSSVRSVLQVWYPGEEGAAAIADVIFGASEPGGRLAVSYPARVEDSSGAATYPPVDGELRYSDGLFVGYRHHEAHGIDPVFSFGHGLSYTAFEYGELAVTAAGDSGEVVATVEVSNVGQRAGSEVVQLYVRDVESSQPRPVKELKGFAKIRLAAGERQVARFALDRRAFSRFSSDQHDWIVEPGEFELLAGSSSQNIRARATIHVD